MELIKTSFQWALQQQPSVIGQRPPRLPLGWNTYVCWSQILQCFASKVCSVLPYTLDSPTVAFKKFLHSTLSVHFAFDSLNSSDLSLNVFHSVQLFFTISTLHSLPIIWSSFQQDHRLYLQIFFTDYDLGLHKSFFYWNGHLRVDPEPKDFLSFLTVIFFY